MALAVVVASLFSVIAALAVPADNCKKQAGNTGRFPWQNWMTSDWTEFPPSTREKPWIWGYTGKFSYVAGEEVDLHISTSEETFEIEVVREGAKNEMVHSSKSHPGTLRKTPQNASAHGCGWPTEATIRVDEMWRSGGYVVVLRVRRPPAAVIEQEAFFVVRNESATRSPIALVLATSTWTAYNNFGGGSSYSNPEVDLSDPDAARKMGFFPELSTQRPWHRGMIRIPKGAPRMPNKDKLEPHGIPRWPNSEWAMANGYSLLYAAAGWASYDSHLARWLEAEGYDVDFFTQTDVHFGGAALLRPYRIVITGGHDEYWSRPTRQAVDDWVTQGGHYVRLGGNIIWQVRLSDDGKMQTCYKYVADEKDPMAKDPTQNTNAWEARSVDWPPVQTFGANGARGVYVRFGAYAPRHSGAFTVYRPEHWAFNNTDLYYADSFGEDLRPGPLVGWEVDGVEYTFTNGLPNPTGGDGTPIDGTFTILAMTPVTKDEQDHGHMPPGSFVYGGTGDWDIFSVLIHGDLPEEEARARSRFGSAIISFMEKGAGSVFCAATVEWPYALTQHDFYSEQITRNVIKRAVG